jgi:hypothetical protein
LNVFLIDADNLNSGAWVDEAFRILEATEGPMPVRRAYGSAENLKGLAEALRNWAVRPFVNLSLSKNTTDIALAVDAMALACQTPRPATVVIGSGDADFVPLVVRLRELGIRMVCVSERGKMGREAVSAYDRVILVGQEQALFEAQQAGTPQAPTLGAVSALSQTKVARKAAKKSPPEKASVVKVPAKRVAAKKAASPSTKAKKSPVNSIDAHEAKEAPLLGALTDRAGELPNPPEVQAILLAMPALQTGQAQALAAVARVLLEAKLRGKNMTATRLLKKYPLHFSLLPTEKPRTVTFTPRQDNS